LALAHGESGADGVVVGEETGGESAQRWNAAGLGCRDPGIEVMALALTSHAGEVTDQVVDRAKGLASIEYVSQLCVFVRGQRGCVAGVAKNVPQRRRPISGDNAARTMIADPNRSSRTVTGMLNPTGVFYRTEPSAMS
jgi:hypothetical protein